MRVANVNRAADLPSTFTVQKNENTHFRIEPELLRELQEDLRVRTLPYALSAVLSPNPTLDSCGVYAPSTCCGWHKYVYQYLGITPESDLRDDTGDKTLMLRREESSWRREFVLRYNLRRYVMTFSGKGGRPCSWVRVRGVHTCAADSPCFLQRGRLCCHASELPHVRRCLDHSQSVSSDTDSRVAPHMRFCLSLLMFGHH